MEKFKKLEEETKNGPENSKEIQRIVTQCIEDFNNSEAFEKLKKLGIENLEEFISFLKNTVVTEDTEIPTQVGIYTQKFNGEFNIYYININNSEKSFCVGKKNKKNDITHEFAHITQKFLKEKKILQTTKLDEKCLNLIPYINPSLPYLKEILEDISSPKKGSIEYDRVLTLKYPELFKESELNEKEKSSLNLLYFINGSGALGLERLAFLRETRQELLENGIIKFFQEKITVEKIEKFLNFCQSNRILSFLNKNEKSIKILVELLNETP